MVAAGGASGGNASGSPVQDPQLDAENCPVPQRDQSWAASSYGALVKAFNVAAKSRTSDFRVNVFTERCAEPNGGWEPRGVGVIRLTAAAGAGLPEENSSDGSSEQLDLAVVSDSGEELCAAELLTQCTDFVLMPQKRMAQFTKRAFERSSSGSGTTFSLSFASSKAYRAFWIIVAALQPEAATLEEGVEPEEAASTPAPQVSVQSDQGSEGGVTVGGASEEGCSAPHACDSIPGPRVGSAGRFPGYPTDAAAGGARGGKPSAHPLLGDEFDFDDPGGVRGGGGDEEDELGRVPMPEAGGGGGGGGGDGGGGGCRTAFSVGGASFGGGGGEGGSFSLLPSSNFLHPMDGAPALFSSSPVRGLGEQLNIFDLASLQRRARPEQVSVPLVRVMLEQLRKVECPDVLELVTCAVRAFLRFVTEEPWLRRLWTLFTAAEAAEAFVDCESIAEFLCRVIAVHAIFSNPWGGGGGGGGAGGGGPAGGGYGAGSFGGGFGGAESLLLDARDPLVVLLSDAHYEQLFSAMRYEPEFRKLGIAVDHVDFLKRRAVFRPVLAPDEDDAFRRAADLMYRLLYLKDVCLPRQLDEFSLRHLNAAIEGGYAYLSRLLVARPSDSALRALKQLLPASADAGAFLRQLLTVLRHNTVRGAEEKKAVYSVLRADGLLQLMELYLTGDCPVAGATPAEPTLGPPEAGPRPPKPAPAQPALPPASPPPAEPAPALPAPAQPALLPASPAPASPAPASPAPASPAPTSPASLAAAAPGSPASPQSPLLRKAAPPAPATESATGASVTVTAAAVPVPPGASASAENFTVAPPAAAGHSAAGSGGDASDVAPGAAVAVCDDGDAGGGVGSAAQAVGGGEASVGGGGEEEAAALIENRATRPSGSADDGVPGEGGALGSDPGSAAAASGGAAANVAGTGVAGAGITTSGGVGAAASGVGAAASGVGAAASGGRPSGFFLDYSNMTPARLPDLAIDILQLASEYSPALLRHALLSAVDSQRRPTLWLALTTVFTASDNQALQIVVADLMRQAVGASTLDSLDRDDVLGLFYDGGVLARLIDVALTPLPASFADLAADARNAVPKYLHPNLLYCAREELPEIFGPAVAEAIRATETGRGHAAAACAACAKSAAAADTDCCVGRGGRSGGHDAAGGAGGSAAAARVAAGAAGCAAASCVAAGCAAAGVAAADLAARGSRLRSTSSDLACTSPLLLPPAKRRRSSAPTFPLPEEETAMGDGPEDAPEGVGAAAAASAPASPLASPPASPPAAAAAAPGLAAPAGVGGGLSPPPALPAVAFLASLPLFKPLAAGGFRATAIYDWLDRQEGYEEAREDLVYRARAQLSFARTQATEILSFCVLVHLSRMKIRNLETELPVCLLRAACLPEFDPTFALHAVKYLRACLLGDHYHRIIIDSDSFGPVFHLLCAPDLVPRSLDRADGSALESAILELLGVVAQMARSQRHVHAVLQYIVERYSTELAVLERHYRTYCPHITVFQHLLAQGRQRPKAAADAAAEKSGDAAVAIAADTNKFFARESEYMREERYFDEDDEEEEVAAASAATGGGGAGPGGDGAADLATDLLDSSRWTSFGGMRGGAGDGDDEEEDEELGVPQFFRRPG